MSLPDPIPDDPRKWEGWRTYTSKNYYERLGFLYEENPTDGQIEEACRKLLVWWQKKLPLKSQPSNPLAQLLRDGLDEAPQFLVEARAFLLDPLKRSAFNDELRDKHKQGAADEFRKYVNFAITSGQLAAKDEAALLRVGQEAGLSTEEIIEVVDAQLEERGAQREVREIHPAPPQAPLTPVFPYGDPRVTPAMQGNMPLPMPMQAYPYPQGGYVTPLTQGYPTQDSGRRTPVEEFRRVLKMSGMNIEGMVDEQRIAFIAMGANMGVPEMEAEDILDDYLDDDTVHELPPMGNASGGQAPPPQQYYQQPVYLQPPPGYAMPPQGYVPVQHVTPQFVVPQQSPYFPQPQQLSPLPQPQAQPQQFQPHQTPSLEQAPPTPAPAPVPEARVRLSPTQERTQYPDFTNTLGMEMRLVYSGVFRMGNESPVSMPHERPVRDITISRFFMARHPVTNLQYEMFEASHKMKRPEWSKDNHPVVNVTSADAIRFCEWLTTKEGNKFIYRLPTEGEWEYAARGGDNRVYPWGSSKGRGDVANYADVNTKFAWSDRLVNDGYAYTSPVGAFPRGASPFGIEDMSGNVWEWCLDYYGPYRPEELVNPKGVPRSDKRVCRGGSWRSKLASLRTSFRHFNVLNYSFLDQGFRIVRECDPPPPKAKPPGAK